MPAEPIVRALRKYLRECDPGAKRNGFNTGQGEARYTGPFVAVAERVGVNPDTVWRWTNNPYRTMGFDKADRILAAINQTELWLVDSVLSEVYERAVIGADHFSPIVAKAA